MSGTIRARRQRLSWLSVGAAWVLFGLGAFTATVDARGWPAWGACYVLALALWFPVPHLIRKRVQS